MPLVDLLYRCPFCGGRTTGEAYVARCGDCERTFEASERNGAILVGNGDAGFEDVPVGALVDRVSDDELRRGTLEADAVARFAREESPVRYRRQVLGFYEERGPPLPGRLRLDEAVIRFTEEGGEIHEWPLLDLAAVQTASAAVQISLRGGGLVSFRISADSPRRWEEALKSRLREVWRSEGRGEILEFQPRIRAR